jgi:hypothetical protein
MNVLYSLRSIKSTLLSHLLVSCSSLQINYILILSFELKHVIIIIFTSTEIATT